MVSNKELYKSKTVVLDVDCKKWIQGVLKFINKNEKFGFIIWEDNGNDIFFHFSEITEISNDMIE